jgi:hypothetical protein
MVEQFAGGLPTNHKDVSMRLAQRIIRSNLRFHREDVQGAVGCQSALQVRNRHGQCRDGRPVYRRWLGVSGRTLTV